MIEKTVNFVRSYATSHPLLFVAYSLLTTIVLYLVVAEVQRRGRKIPGFSGPPELPIIGNLHQIRVNAAEQYRIWSRKHGAVYQIMLGNVPVLVVNSAAAAKAIFGQNSQALSSRPEFYTFHKVVSSTSGTTIGTSPFSESLKRRRKGAASALNKPSVQTYLPHIDLETKDYLNEFLQYGDAGQKSVDPLPMIQRLSLSLALTLNWGTRMASQNDELFGEITYVEDEVSKFRSTTGNLQDYIPLLRLNPLGLVSGRAREMRRRRDVYLNKLNKDLDDRIEKGTHHPCIQANVILDKEAKLNTEELTSISLTMLSGGLDTLTNLTAWAIALLAERPDVQQKAVEEIDKFYEGKAGPLCDIEDDQGCIYIVAMVREILRYYAVLRLSLPRATVKDFQHEGKTIPVGTVIFLNAWACNMDPDVWSDPETFRPERWLSTNAAGEQVIDGEKPLFTYGLGYRMCAGSLLANREMYTIWIRTLKSFRIEKGVDAEKWLNTHPVHGVEDQTQLVSVPHRYKVRMVPRDEEALREALSETQ